MTTEGRGSSAISPSLTTRQWDVLRHVASGDGFTEVGHQMGISEQTVKNHMTNIRRRLGATSAMDCLAIVGWLRVPEY